MQGKSKLVVLLIAGILIIAVVVVLILNPTRSVPVKVTLQSYTNGCAVIRIKNQTSLSFKYAAMLERKMDGEWPERPEGLVLPELLGPGEQTNLTIKVMVSAPSYPWRISVFCGLPSVHVNSMRIRAGVWCLKYGFPNVSRKLLEGGGRQPIETSTPEMAQW